MASPIFKLCFLLLQLTTSFCFSNGFTLDLIHRDSPLSPLYNPSQSHSDRLLEAALRSLSRINHFKSSSSSSTSLKTPPFAAISPSPEAEPPIAISPSPEAETLIKSGNGEYIMNISLGNPPVNINAIADTGSDLIWTQCQPCKSCYKQNDPVFDPSKSSTYRDLACTSTPCSSLASASGCDSQMHCTYTYSYGDQSYTSGDLAAETVTLGSASGRPVVLPATSFGCGHDNGGTFDATASGIVGLGGGPLSLVAQLGSIAAGKFSYCLVPYGETKTTSKIKFGGDAVVSGEGAVSTPLVSKYPDTYYYLTLEAMSVGDKNLTTFSNVIEGTDGNIIIDSGTTLTILPSNLLSGVVAALEGAISGNRTHDPSGTFDLCYSSSDNGEDLNIPNITAHFKGADVLLGPENTFVEIQEGVVCLAMIGSSDLAIFGNLSQMNFLIGYDLEGKTVSFKPTDCTQ